MRIFALLPLLVAECGSGGPPAEAEPEAERALEEPSPAEVALDTRVTTRSDIAVRNFQARVEALREQQRRAPQDLALRATLVEHLLARATFLGTFDDFDEADTLSRGREGPEGALLRASFLSAVHRFEEARAKLAEAARLGAPEHLVERARLVVDLAVGEDPAGLLPRARTLTAASESYAHWTVLASVLAALGRYEQADATYLRALSIYRDTSPFPLAWVSFTRGVMWGEAAGRPDRARVLYADAVARLPDYVVANVHLSELEEPEQARARLEGVLASGDPEPSARLAQRLDGPRRAALFARARARYESLLSRHREAFLDHASEFYAMVGEPQRALELALENLTVRRNGRAYVVALRAAEAAGEQATVCRLVDEAAPLRTRHRVLDALAAELEGRCP